MTVPDTIIDLSDQSYNNDQSTNEQTSNIEIYMESPIYIEDNSMPIIEYLPISCPTVGVQAPGAPELPAGCPGAPKYSGNTINLAASPSGGVGPYHVRFFRMPATGGAMSYGELGSMQTFAEGSMTPASTSFTLYDTDLVAASGKGNAGYPTTNSAGDVIEPNDSTFPLGDSMIRVITTVYDSCPVVPMSCISSCDVSLGCVAPTCNFTVI